MSDDAERTHANAGAKRRARVAPLADADWSPRVVSLLGGTRASVASLEGSASTATSASTAGPPEGGYKTLNILRTIAHHEGLLGPFLAFSSALALQGELSRRDSEMLALRSAWNSQSEFEWGHHVVYARAAGLSDSEIAAIALGPDADDWNSTDRDLLLAADQLHRTQQIEDGLWNRLRMRFGDAQLVEIPFVVGQYTMLSMVANSTGVALESGYDSLPQNGSRPQILEE